MPSTPLDRLPSVAPQQALAFRVERQHLGVRVPARGLVAVVRDIVGAQAQVPSAAALSLAVRMDGLTPDALDDALQRRRTLARMWCLRGTTHVVARGDHPLLAAALGPEVGGFFRVLRRRGMSEATFRRLADVVMEGLADGPLDRTAIREFVAHHAPSHEHFFGSWGGVLRLLSQEGRIVFGPSRAGKTTFVRADRWWPAHSASSAPTDPLGELLRRYLRSYGPAIVADFSYWSGVGGAEVRAARDRIAEDLVEVDVGGAPRLLLRADADALLRAVRSESIRLLPVFDSYLLAHRDKSLYLDRARYKAVFRAAGWVSAAVVRGGRVVGTWTSREDAVGLRVDLTRFEPLPRGAASLLHEEVERLAAWRATRLARIV